ncbi:hypothetical protein SH528x_001914 [Novipirellula sp. SH528]|uniref:hypothetical protein n=1 Tax=Novipirellula sp. SH528 TaxID=3454466 RepID=UPI003FA0C0BF
MPATAISDLLPLSAETKNPHPYQIFGLTGGEQDSQVIVAAIKETIQKLQSAKPDADPAVWKKAAKWVQQSRDILLDPAKKKALDVRFGVIDFGDTESPQVTAAPISAPSAVPPPPGAAPKSDPLAGLLPKSDPLAGVLPAGNPLAPQMPPVPQAPVAATPAPTFSASPAPVTDAAPIAAAAPIAIKKKAPKRRRKSMAGWFVFLGCAMAILAMVGSLIWVLMFKPGTIAITAKDGSFTLSTNPGGSANEASPPSSGRVKSRPVDPIMGNLNQPSFNDNRGQGGQNMRPAPSMPQTTPSEPVPSEPEQPAATPPAPQENGPPETMDPEMGEPEKMDPIGSTPASTTPESTTPTSTTPDPTVGPVMMPVETMSKELIAEAEALITKARTAIKSADWSQLRAVHEVAVNTQLSEEQRPLGEPLFEIADLATYYRGAIERGVATLQTGSDFELTETLRVIVVEKGPDRLVIRFNATIKAYTYDELPPRLADKLATFALNPGDPTAIAAQAVYQAIAPKSTESHRQEAIQKLETFSGEVEGANPKNIAQAFRDLFKS